MKYKITPIIFIAIFVTCVAFGCKNNINTNIEIAKKGGVGELIGSD